MPEKRSVTNQAASFFDPPKTRVAPLDLKPFHTDFGARNGHTSQASPAKNRADSPASKRNGVSNGQRNWSALTRTPNQKSPPRLTLEELEQQFKTKNVKLSTSNKNMTAFNESDYGLSLEELDQSKVKNMLKEANTISKDIEPTYFSDEEEDGFAATKTQFPKKPAPNQAVKPSFNGKGGMNNKKKNNSNLTSNSTTKYIIATPPKKSTEYKNVSNSASPESTDAETQVDELDIKIEKLSLNVPEFKENSHQSEKSSQTPQHNYTSHPPPHQQTPNNRNIVSAPIFQMPPPPQIYPQILPQYPPNAAIQPMVYNGAWPNTFAQPVYYVMPNTMPMPKFSNSFQVQPQAFYYAAPQMMPNYYNGQQNYHKHMTHGNYNKKFNHHNRGNQNSSFSQPHNDSN